MGRGQSSLPIEPHPGHFVTLLTSGKGKLKFAIGLEEKKRKKRGQVDLHSAPALALGPCQAAAAPSTLLS